jgi:hypothetical protein
LLQPLEHLREKGRIDPLAVIADFNASVRIGLDHANAHMSALRRELDRI